MNDDLNERLDIAAWVSQGEQAERWLEVHQGYRDDIRRAREAIFAELAAAGYAVVPREPTEAMLMVNEDDAFSSNPECTIHARREHWRAMIAAAEQGQER